MFEVEYACTMHPVWYSDSEHGDVQTAIARAQWVYQSTGRSVRVVNIYEQVVYLMVGQQHPGCR